MVAIRATFLIENGKNGASESFWCDAPDLTAAIAKADSLAKVRARLFGNTGVLTYIRVSKDAVYRDAQVVVARYTGDPREIEDGAKGVPLFLVSGSAPMWTSVLCRGTNGDFYRSLFFLRNAPGSLFTAADELNLDPQWAKGFDVFKAKLIADQWGAMFASKEADHPEFPIKNATTNLGVMTIEIAAVPGWVVGDKVSVRNINWVKPTTAKSSGPLTITAVAGFVYTLTGSIAGIGVYRNGGFVRKYDKVFKPFANAIVERGTRRASGRSFFLQRGRRPAGSFR